MFINIFKLQQLSLCDYIISKTSTLHISKKIKGKQIVMNLWCTLTSIYINIGILNKHKCAFFCLLLNRQCKQIGTLLTKLLA